MNLTFHAGLPKTGSSYVQQFALLNRELLERYGVHYPVDELLMERRSKVRNPSGNGLGIHKALLEEDSAQFEIKVNEALQGISERTSTILLSHEGFYDSLAKLNSERIQILKRLGVDGIRIILILRDPVEWLFSLYKQKCRRGCRISIADFLAENKSMDKFFRFVDFLGKSEFLCPVFLDFRVCRLDLASCILSNINTSGEFVAEEFVLPKGIVNRSLSLREIRVLQWASWLLSGSVLYRISERISAWGGSSTDARGLRRFTRVLNKDPSSCREIEMFNSITREMFSSQG